jgi:hypothetical protein
MSMSDRGGETRLTDERLASEIELLGEVIAVAATHLGPFTPDEVDEVLGVREPEPPRAE